MTGTIAPAAVRRSITVEAPRERAFEVFTASFGRWWPRSHKIGSAPMQSAAIEPRVGGRWYEIGDDGSECQWGDVLVWEPPARIVLAWRIGADWRFNPNLLTEVEVRFIPAGDGKTRVELEHRKLENMGTAMEAARAAFESERGWNGILANYQRALAER
ncbi:SRPBCC family protein [Siccirubricoccus sp. KC 17139]|uniref:SRPBCC family protein n=1 Tax=Siccirubricoccus soli TaxID=2899147 RepID=A0ABT1D2J6_9PROT|nr:SRPBCC family protein [Siccirubricoccus soli]MCO6416135.1 SRPBCC family protein [Siccirubricoccus soli]MCP2682269.1 SRPBCC family protein [Siccirubricoccus soli]